MRLACTLALASSVAVTALAAVSAQAATDPTAKVLAGCEQAASRCYDVDMVRHAYGIDRLARKGIDGSGTTVAIIMSPSSFLETGLTAQSNLYDLAPADLTIATPAGDPGAPGTFTDQVEPTLDTQAVHAMAPGAKLLFLALPQAAMDGSVLQDAPLAKAVDYAVAAGADVISMSFGGLEKRYPLFRAALARAAAAGVPAFAGSGDQGVTMTGHPGRQTFYPAADPNVTAVGGTLLTLDEQGRRLAPDVAWGPDANGGASGGGVSKYSARPAWQRKLAGTQGTKRNYPDVSMLAAASGSFLVLFPGAKDDIAPIDGTSVATPMMAGIAALARQVAGHRLMHVNQALYTLAKHRKRNGIVDVVVGNNTYSNAKNGATNGSHNVTGYLAGPGYDLVTGLGTVDPTRFVGALARAAR